jgi:hypothetical protein
MDTPFFIIFMKNVSVDSNNMVVHMLQNHEPVSHTLMGVIEMWSWL